MSAIGSRDGGATVEDEATRAEINHNLFFAVGVIGTAVVNEMDRQDTKWGVQDHDPATWWLIIAEEDGKTAQAILQGRFGDAEHEMVQGIACRLRLIEKLRRTKP